MKTWFVTTVSPGESGKYDVQLSVRLNELEEKGHTIFLVTPVSGGISIISYTESP